MNKIHQFAVWLKRIGHCGGFGIQSPTDYRFARGVINEKWPYHAYDLVGEHDRGLKQKLGRLYLRLANEVQPDEVIDLLGVMDYVNAGCKKAHKVQDCDKVQLAFVPIACDYDRLFEKCGHGSVVVFQDIYKQMPLWHCIEYDRRVSITYDLYYCGIVIFDDGRSPHNYVVNF